MAITVQYTPVPAVTELAQQAGKQAGQRWQAEYQRPYDLQQLEAKSQMERLGADNAASLERLGMQIGSNEKLQTQENQQRIQEIGLNNTAAMERLQAGDFNTAQRMYAGIDADFKKLDTTISADERSLAERNRAAMELLQAGDYNAAQRLQTSIDADLKKTDTTQQFQKEQDYRRAEIEQELLAVNNDYDYQRLLLEQQLNAQSQQQLLQGKYAFDTRFELQKYQMSKLKEAEQKQKQDDEFQWISDEIDNNSAITDEQKITAKTIARSKIYDYTSEITRQDLYQPTISDQIKAQDSATKMYQAQNQAQYQQGQLGQGQQRIDQAGNLGQQRIDTGNRALDIQESQNQRELELAYNTIAQKANSGQLKSLADFSKSLMQENILETNNGGYVKATQKGGYEEKDGKGYPTGRYIEKYTDYEPVPQNVADVFNQTKTRLQQPQKSDIEAELKRRGLK